MMPMPHARSGNSNARLMTLPARSGNPNSRLI